MKTSVTISIDTAALQHHTDGHLAVLWHVAQANPAAYGDKQAGELAEAVGFEIIRRFMRTTEPVMCTHQPKDFAAAMVVRDAGFTPFMFKKKTNIVITGPQGCGKTYHGKALAEFYGMSRVEDLNRAISYPDGTLLLTNEPIPGAIDFEAAMRAVGLTSLAAAA
jgi:hypothetical protein